MKTSPDDDTLMNMRLWSKSDERHSLNNKTKHTNEYSTAHNTQQCDEGFDLAFRSTMIKRYTAKSA